MIIGLEQDDFKKTRKSLFVISFVAISVSQLSLSGSQLEVAGLKLTVQDIVIKLTLLGLLAYYFWVFAQNASEFYLQQKSEITTLDFLESLGREDVKTEITMAIQESYHNAIQHDPTLSKMITLKDGNQVVGPSVSQLHADKMAKKVVSLIEDAKKSALTRVKLRNLWLAEIVPVVVVSGIAIYLLLVAVRSFLSNPPFVPSPLAGLPDSLNALIVAP